MEEQVKFFDLLRPGLTKVVIALVLLSILFLFTGCTTEDTFIIKQNVTVNSTINNTIYVNGSVQGATRPYLYINNSNVTVNLTAFASIFLTSESDPIFSSVYLGIQNNISSKLSTSTFISEMSVINQTIQDVNTSCLSQPYLTPLMDSSGNGNNLTNFGMIYLGGEYSGNGNVLREYMQRNFTRNYTLANYSLHSKVIYYSNQTDATGIMWVGDLADHNPAISLNINTATDTKCSAETTNVSGDVLTVSTLSYTSGINISRDFVCTVNYLNNVLNLSLYVDGTFYSSITRNNVSTFTFNISMVRLGAQKLAFARYLNGSISESEFFNKTLSPSEVLDLYNGEPIDRSGLIAEYLFENQSGFNGCNSSDFSIGNLNADEITLNQLYVNDKIMNNLTVEDNVSADAFVTQNQGFGYIVLNNDSILFYNGTGINKGRFFYQSATSTTLTWTSSFLSQGTMTTDNDIATSGNGDDLYLGTTTQAGAKFQANASGAVRAENLTLNDSLMVKNNSTLNNVNITGNLTFNGFYGEMFMDNGFYVVVISSTDTYVEIANNLSSGFLNGFIFVDNSSLNLTREEGLYRIDYSISAKTASVANKEVESAILLNGVAQTKGTSHAEVSPGGSNRPETMSGQGLFYLNASSRVSLGVSNHNDGTDIIIEHVSLVVERVGN